MEKIKKYYWSTAFVNFALLIFIYYQLFHSSYHWEGSNDKKFIVGPGSNSDEIINSLKSSDIISNSLLFKIALKLSGKENQLLSNTYIFRNGLSNSEIISILTDMNSIHLVRITVPPGYNLKQIASRIVEKKLLLSKEKFLRETSNDSLINILDLKGKIKDLEGFLYPDSYDVAQNITEKELVLLLFNEFMKKVLDDDRIESEIESRETSLLETVTLASIIEGETRLEDEKPIIASVYLNRIKKGMRLEADPTIQYILPNGPKSRLLFEDLKIKSPYNTYLNKGLPPGPINNPGITSIRAALNPAEHDYLFFVATGEGGHKFTENYAQHLVAVKEYKAKLREKKKQDTSK